MARNYEGPGPLRSHQKAMIAIAERMVNDPDFRIAILNCVPGGGKTKAMSILAHSLFDLLDITNVLVVCPRDTLRSQAEQGFTDPARDLTMRIYSNEYRHLSQGDVFHASAAIGYAVTVQSLCHKGNTDRARYWAKRMRRGKWLLVIDEAHHVAAGADAELGEDPAWCAALTLMVDAAKRTLLMSGTLRRHDGQKIAFVPYEDRAPVAHVTYTLADALRERALVPISFKLMDGEATSRRRGVETTTTLSEAKRSQLGDALRAALEEPGFAHEWLFEAIDDWQRFRRETTYRSRMIVVCKNITAARAVFAALSALYPSYDPVLAVSADVGASKKIIKFRDRGEGEILVTVNMAYEGLDVPDCTHVVVLSNVQSEPWLEQVIGRVTRFNHSTHGNPVRDLPWERQRAFVYLMHTPPNVEFVKKMNKEQEHFLPDAPKPGKSVPRGRSSFESIDGEKGVATLAMPGRVFTEEEIEFARELERERPGLTGTPIEELVRLVYDLGRLRHPAAE